MAGETGEPVGEPPARRRRRGLTVWLLSTALLAVACATVGWYAAGRTPEVVERLVEAPPGEPSLEQEARAAQLARLAQSLEARLTDQLAELENPPVCRPNERLDRELFEDLRRREARNLEAWREVALRPSPAGTVPAPAARRAPAVSGEAAPAVVPAPAIDGGTGTAGVTPAALAPPAAMAAARSLGQLRELLEGSSAMVLGLSAEDGLSTGTAFFVAPDLMVTNRHVVEAADTERLMVTSKQLGGLSPVELVAVSAPGDEGAPDFALLRLRAGAAPAVAPIAAGGGKLTPVIAAGYPGLGLRDDAGFRRLLEGDAAAAPDLNMNRGEVRSIQPLGAITRLVHTADVLKGYSGGPLLDTCGRVVGVNTFIQVDQAQGGKLNNAVSTADLVAFLGQHGVRLPLDARACGEG